MADVRSIAFFRRADACESALCVRLNRGCRQTEIRLLFATVSRLGDGIFWYAIMLALPALYGTHGALVAGRMVVTGAAGVAIYKYLKSRLVRERPFIALAGIVPGTPPLDRHSFPSGHTLHAVAMTTLAMADFPALGWLLVPFTGLVAASRVVLGLHYPTDVVAGALLGAGLAVLVLAAG